MAKHNELGKLGERLANTFIEELGYEVIEVNWQKRKYEIDIIALDQKEFVFIEVKARSSDMYGKPEEAVTNKKQRHLIEGADYYLQENEIDLEARFDVISILFNAAGQDIRHIKNAFYPEV